MIKNKTGFTIVISIFLILSNLFADNNIRQDSTVYTRDNILKMGILNTADLIKRSRYHNFFTVDGSNFYPVPDIPAIDNNEICIFINNHKTDISILNTTAVNTLPLNISSIDSVIFYKPGSFVNGYFCRKGAVKLISGLDKNTLIGGFLIGNEINDPGPYLYVDGKESRNVDKIGIDGYLTAFGKFRQLGGCLSFKRDQRFFTDEHIYKRQQHNLSADTRKSHYVSLNSSFKNNELFLSYSSNNENIFLNTTGNEIPALSTAYNLNYFLDLNRFGFAVSSNITDVNRYGKTELDHFDFSQSRNRISAILNLGKHLFSYTILNKIFVTENSFECLFFFNPTYSFRNSNLDLHMETTIFSNHIHSYNLFAGYIKRFCDSYSFSLDASFSKEPFMDNYEFLFINDYNIPVFSDSFTLDNKLDSDYFHNAGLRLSLSHQGNRFGCSFSSNNNFFKNIILPGQHFKIDTIDYRFYSPVVLENIDHGFTSSLDLKFDMRFKRIYWENSLEYFILKKGSHYFEDLFAKNSDFIIKSSFSYDMNNRMFLNLNLDYSGKRYFMEYDSSQHSITGQLEDMVGLDLNLTKFFFRDHLKIILSFQNILDQHLIFHPAGAGKDFTLFTKVELRF